MQTVISIAKEMEGVSMDRGVQGGIPEFEALSDEPTYLDLS